MPPKRPRWRDLPLYLSQWGYRDAMATFARFRDKWQLAPDDPFLRDHAHFITDHRGAIIAPGGGQLLPAVAGRIQGYDLTKIYYYCTSSDKLEVVYSK